MASWINGWAISYTSSLPASISVTRRTRCEPLEDGGQVIEGSASQPKQISQLGPLPDHGQQLDGGQGRAIQIAQTGLHPGGEVLGQGLQGRMLEVGALLQQGSQQPGHEQRAACRPLGQPVDEGVRDRPLDQLDGHLADLLTGQRVDRHAGEQAFLLEGPHHVTGHRVLGQLAGTGDEQHQQTANRPGFG